ncbi:MAG: hypothetical protein IIT70_02885 [Clostridia bacterium]|nr:hypothetical protein [Clostridia bacterium]MBQ3939278.1 hypothetical protein [Clostridia bacterium]MBQ5487784.1 hypothetical protein [Clostridia bacterium]
MSIFSKIIKNIVNAVEQQANELKPEKPEKPSSVTIGGMTIGGGHVDNVVCDAPESGFSWGSNMPAEENQFNYKGTYKQYFENVFKEAFPEYGIVRTDLENRDASTFAFFRGETKVLVVEVMSDRSSAQRIRRECRANGIRYLRYYHNHHGWWNTKAYVIERTGNALNG